MKTITVPTLSKTPPGEPMLEHAIRLRAYDLYAQRGMAEGPRSPGLVRGGSRAANDTFRNGGSIARRVNVCHMRQMIFAPKWGRGFLFSN